MSTVGWKSCNAARSVFASADNAAPDDATGSSHRWKYTWSVAFGCSIRVDTSGK